MHTRLFRLFGILFLAVFSSQALQAQHVAIKNNLFYDATLTPNLGLEFRLAKKWSADIMVGYNPFTFSDNKKLKHIAVQPEVRYWLCETFNGHFFAANLLYSHFNAGHVKLPLGLFPSLENHRYQGNLGAIGIGYGYDFILGKHWGLELEATVGVYMVDRKKYLCQKCGTEIDKKRKVFVAPTRVAANVVYYF